ALSAGIYVLPAGAVDPQQPHKEDEIYHVVSGRGMLRVGTEDYPVEPGSVVLVPAEVEHRFCWWCLGRRKARKVSACIADSSRTPCGLVGLSWREVLARVGL